MSQPRNKCKKDLQDTQESFNIRLSGLEIFFVGLFALGIITWSFYMGFMVGKGEDPVKAIAWVANFTDNTTDPQISSPPPADIQSDKPVKEISPDTSNEDISESSQEQKKEFVDSQIDNQSSTIPPPHPFTRPSGASLAAWETSPKTTATLKKEEPKKEVSAKKDSETSLVDYVYQVAAFYKKTEADDLCKILLGKKMRAVAKKEGKVFLVIVRLRGTQKDATSLLQTFKEMRLGKPVLLSHAIIRR